MIAPVPECLPGNRERDAGDCCHDAVPHLSGVAFATVLSTYSAIYTAMSGTGTTKGESLNQVVAQ